MSQNNHPAIKHKLGLLELADQLKNVSRACKVMGVSRDTFYRVQSAFEEGGIDAQLAKSKKIPNPKNRVEPHVEEAVCKLAIDNPALGQTRVSNELRKLGIFVCVRPIHLLSPPQNHHHGVHLLLSGHCYEFISFTTPSAQDAA